MGKSLIFPSQLWCASIFPPQTIKPEIFPPPTLKTVRFTSWPVLNGGFTTVTANLLQ
jgi:hypothetical protein